MPPRYPPRRSTLPILATLATLLLACGDHGGAASQVADPLEFSTTTESITGTSDGTAGSDSTDIDGSGDGGAPNPSGPCSRPTGMYSVEATDTRSSDTDYECTPPDTAARQWITLDQDIEYLVDGVRCIEHADMYSEGGCVYRSLLSCEDGSSAELVCGLSADASSLRCTATLDHLVTICGHTLRFTRSDG